MTRPTWLAAALCLTSMTWMSGCSADAGDDGATQAEEITSGRIVVHHGAGATISKWGYDVKQDGRSRALKPALAAELYQQIGMNMLRVPVRAAEAHPSAGVGNIKDGAYADDLSAIANVKAVSPQADIFASVKLLGANSFPGWVKSGGEVDPAPYAVLLENYLAYMHAHGVTIDWLGVDNEARFNEGNITPQKYNQIVSDIEKWCAANGVKTPGFIAPENYGPTEDTPWLEDLARTNAGFSNVDHVGVHIYSKHRDAAYVDAMHTLSDHIHGKGLWDSEMHWNDLAQDGDVRFDDLKQGLLTAMDHFDVGFHALTWWAFQPRSAGTKAGHIVSDLVSSTVGSSVLATDDIDGRSLALNKLNSRAFKNGANQVTVWVANFGDKQKLETQIEGEKVASASFVQWSSTGGVAGDKGSASLVKGSPASFAMAYPANTITRVTVTLK